MANPSATRVVNVADPTDPTRLLAVNSDGSINVVGDAANTWLPADHGLIAWAYDGSQARGALVIPTAGLVHTVRLKIRKATSITNIHLITTATCASLTSGQCFAGIFQGGTLIGVTADQSTAWLSTGEKKMALASGPFPVAVGDLIVAAYANTAGTLPTFSCGSNFLSLLNVNLTAANSRFATADTGRTTTFPGTLGALTAASHGIWMGVS